MCTLKYEKKVTVLQENELLRSLDKIIRIGKTLEIKIHFTTKSLNFVGSFSHYVTLNEYAYSILVSLNEAIFVMSRARCLWLPKKKSEWWPLRFMACFFFGGQI